MVRSFSAVICLTNLVTARALVEKLSMLKKVGIEGRLVKLCRTVYEKVGLYVVMICEPKVGLPKRKRRITRKISLIEGEKSNLLKWALCLNVKVET